MAKKSFKGGLDNLLASAGIKKKADESEKSAKKAEDKKPLSDDEKDWFLIKIERLEEELKLWRTGNLSVEEFNTSLEKYGLKYNAETNEIAEM
jgi:hypothetical protein